MLHTDLVDRRAEVDQRVRRREVTSIPFTHELPLVGSLRAHTFDRLSFYQHLARQEGGVCGFHLGPLTLLAFSSPRHIQQILVDKNKFFYKGRTLEKSIRPFGGNGLFLSEGEFHREQRKLMAPDFQPRHVKSYAEMIARYGERSAEGWIDDSIVNIEQQMYSLTLAVIGKILFDQERLDEMELLSRCIEVISRHSAYLLSTPFSVPYQWPTPRNRRTQRAVEIILTKIEQMIAERLGDTHEYNDTLSILLRARDDDGHPMSHRQVIDECRTMFAAGHESTAVALSWTWYLLAQHPLIYRRMQQEVDRVLQGRTPAYDDLDSLPYCLRVFKESMRLYPPAYLIMREALDDVVIDGFTVVKGQFVLIPVYGLHRNSDLYPNPEEFNPGRFTAEEEQKRARFAYIPFGAGPRICIGSHLALMEGHLLLATVAQRVTFDLLPNQPIRADVNRNILLGPDRPVMAKVRRR
jgi:cytochrome P450